MHTRDACFYAVDTALPSPKMATFACSQVNAKVWVVVVILPVFFDAMQFLIQNYFLKADPIKVCFARATLLRHVVARSRRVRDGAGWCGVGGVLWCPDLPAATTLILLSHWAQSAGNCAIYSMPSWPFTRQPGNRSCRCVHPCSSPPHSEQRSRRIFAVHGRTCPTVPRSHGAGHAANIPRTIACLRGTGGNAV